MYPHLHRFRFDSKTSFGHKHTILGHTESMIGVNVFHFHYFFGVCAHNGHTHYYSGITGLPVRTENGHIHRIEGILEMNNAHEHSFSNYTFEEIEYIQGRKLLFCRRWGYSS